jgi:hypothetical protein
MLHLLRLKKIVTFLKLFKGFVSFVSFRYSLLLFGIFFI